MIVVVCDVLRHGRIIGPILLVELNWGSLARSIVCAVRLYTPANSASQHGVQYMSIRLFCERTTGLVIAILSCMILCAIWSIMNTKKSKWVSNCKINLERYLMTWNGCWLVSSHTVQLDMSTTVV